MCICYVFGWYLIPARSPTMPPSLMHRTGHQVPFGNTLRLEFIQSLHHKGTFSEQRRLKFSAGSDYYLHFVCRTGSQSHWEHGNQEWRAQNDLAPDQHRFCRRAVHIIAVFTVIGWITHRNWDEYALCRETRSNDMTLLIVNVFEYM